jgi:hypothetical protein
VQCNADCLVGRQIVHGAMAHGCVVMGAAYATRRKRSRGCSATALWRVLKGSRRLPTPATCEARHFMHVLDLDLDWRTLALVDMVRTWFRSASLHRVEMLIVASRGVVTECLQGQASPSDDHLQLELLMLRGRMPKCSSSQLRYTCPRRRPYSTALKPYRASEHATH